MTGILDEYPGAAAAYSLRLLNTDYTGDAVVVRRASDNTTQSIGFVDGELDTTALDAFCTGTDGFVTTWFDQSGNGFDATQTTASSQPQIYDATTGVILDNGNPILRDGLRMNINASITTNGIAQFAVAKNLFTGTRNILNTYYSTSDRYVLAAETSPSSAVFSDIPDVQKLNGSNFSYSRRDIVWVNTLNQSLISLNWNTINTINEISVIGWTSDTFGMWDIQELIIYPTNQSTNITAIETNINNFYNIY